MAVHRGEVFLSSEALSNDGFIGSHPLLESGYTELLDRAI